MNRWTVDDLSQSILFPQRAAHFSLEQWQEWLFMLRHANLLASFYWQAEKHQCIESYPEQVQRHLFSARNYQQRQQQQVLYEVSEIKRILVASGIECVFLKGANYILRQCSTAKGRILSDIDILVKQGELLEAEKMFKLNNWQLKKVSDYDEQYYRKWAHEIPPLRHPLRGTVVDMHHNLYLPISGRAPKIELFWQHTEQLDDGSIVLNAPASLLHSIIHLLMNEDFTNAYRDMLDIHLLIADYQSTDFWQNLTELAKQTGFQDELSMALVLRARLFRGDVPRELTNEVQTFAAKPSNRLLLNVYQHAITPNHTLLTTWRSATARSVAYVRGHWLKMPIHVLCKHFSVKLWLAFLQHILGKQTDTQTSTAK